MDPISIFGWIRDPGHSESRQTLERLGHWLSLVCFLPASPPPSLSFVCCGVGDLCCCFGRKDGGRRLLTPRLLAQIALRKYLVSGWNFDSYQGYVSAALVLGGVDVTGPHLHTRDEGIKLVCDAICSGIFNDLGSGSNVDVCVITKGFCHPNFNVALSCLIKVVYLQASADVMTVEVKRRRHGLRRSEASSSGKCQHSAKEKDGLYNTEIKSDLSIKDINMGSSVNTKRMQKTCLQIAMGNNDPYMLANLKASSEEVVLNIQIQGAQIVSLYLWHLSSSALYQNRLFLKTCSEISSYGDTPLKSSSLLNVKFYKSVDICSTHKNYHPRCIIKDVRTFQQNLKTLKRLNAECDAEVCRPLKKNSVACQIQTFDAPPLPPPQSQTTFSVIHLEKHTSHACEMLSTSTDTCILKNIKQEKEEDGCLDVRQSDSGIVGCKRKTSHIKCPWRKQQHVKDEYMDIPCQSISMGIGNNSQKMQRFPDISGKNGMPSFVNSFHKSVKLDEEIIRKRSTEGGSAPEQLATETLFPHKACNPLAGLDPTSEHNNRHSLDTDFSTGRQEPYAAVEQNHLTSQLVSSKVTENIPFPNLAKQLADEDYQAYVDIIRKHGKLCEELPDEDYRAYVGFFRKHGKLCGKLPDEDYRTYLEATTEHGVYKPSKDSHYKRTSCLMVDEDYVTFLKSIRVQGYSYVLDSRNGARCSVVTETNQNTGLRNKDYNFSLKNATVKGKSLKFERKPVIVSYAKNCSSLKTSERGNSPAKPKTAKRRQVRIPSKIILTSNRGQAPFNVRRRSIRMSQLTEEQVSHSDLPLVHGVPRRDGQGMSSVDLGHMDMISTYPSGRYVSTEPNSFLIALRALLEKPYDKKEHRELMKKATYRKPVTRERNLRGNSKIYRSETMGLSYLDHYPEFHRKIKLANRPEQLNLLRGFFFWLQNPCSPHSFKPWTSFPQEQNMRLGSRRQL